MPTAIGSSTSLASIADMLQVHDKRKIGDLVLDTGERETSLSADAIVQRALNWASGRVESACYKGNRYTPADLAALTNMSLELLESLVCDLAFWWLCKRRHKLAVKAAEVSGVQEAFDLLERLETGEAIFGLQEVADAGSPGTYVETAENKYDRAGIATTARDFFGQTNRLNQEAAHRGDL